MTLQKYELIFNLQNIKQKKLQKNIAPALLFDKTGAFRSIANYLRVLNEIGINNKDGSVVVLENIAGT